MTNYSSNPGKVRADFFKASGKWYTTEEIDMSDLYRGTLIHEAIKTAVVNRLGYLPTFDIVVLEPYHEHAHPVMIRNAG